MPSLEVVDMIVLVEAYRNTIGQLLLASDTCTPLLLFDQLRYLLSNGLDVTKRRLQHTVSCL